MIPGRSRPAPAGRVRVGAARSGSDPSRCPTTSASSSSATSYADLAGEHRGDRVGSVGRGMSSSSSPRQRRTASSALACWLDAASTGRRCPTAASRSWVYIDIGGSSVTGRPCPWAGAGLLARTARSARADDLAGSLRDGSNTTEHRRVEGPSAPELAPHSVPPSPPPHRLLIAVTPCVPLAGLQPSMRLPGSARQGRRSQRGPEEVHRAGTGRTSGIGKWRPRGVAAILQAPLSGKRRVSQPFWLRTPGEGRAESHGLTARQPRAASKSEVTADEAREWGPCRPSAPWRRPLRWSGRSIRSASGSGPGIPDALLDRAGSPRRLGGPADRGCALPEPLRRLHQARGQLPLRLLRSGGAAPPLHGPPRRAGARAASGRWGRSWPGSLPA